MPHVEIVIPFYIDYLDTVLCQPSQSFEELDIPRINDPPVADPEIEEVSEYEKSINIKGYLLEEEVHKTGGYVVHILDMCIRDEEGGHRFSPSMEEMAKS